LVGGLLLKVMSWRGLFAVIATLGMLLLIAVLRLPETMRGRVSNPIFRTLVRVGTEPVFAGYALTGGLSFAAMFAYIAGSPFVLQNIHGLSPLVFSLIFAINGLGIIAAGQASSRLDRFKPYTLLMTGLAFSLAGGMAIVVAVVAGLGLWGLLPGFFLVVASTGLTLPTCMSLALSAWPPEGAGSASAILGLAQFVIGGLAAPLVGIAGPHTALPLAITIGILSIAAPITMALLTNPPGKSRQNPAQTNAFQWPSPVQP
jgi:DHA1 family bicyclomycin/chloramphenicol resistance-like MFS transporter